MKLMMVAIVSMMLAGCASTIEKARADCEKMGYRRGSGDLTACIERTTANRRTNRAPQGTDLPLTCPRPSAAALFHFMRSCALQSGGQHDLGPRRP